MTADLLPLPVSHTRKANEHALSVLLGKAKEISAKLVEADEGRKMERAFLGELSLLAAKAERMRDEW